MTISWILKQTDFRAFHDAGYRESYFFTRAEIKKPMRFECQGCTVSCCSLRPDEEKKILLFPEEVERLETKAIETGNLDFAVVEDLIFPDTLNRTILVGAYRLFLERHPRRACAFLDPETSRCTIHDIRPLVCRGYPVAIKTIDATTREYYLDTGCEFVEQHLDEFTAIKTLTDIQDLKTYFQESFPEENAAAERILIRLAWIPLRLRQLEAEGLITIPDELTTAEWQEALETWDRIDLIPDDAKDRVD